MKKIEGHIISGTGRGSKFISMPVYSDIFTDLLEELPYPGTLNIKLDEKYVERVNRYFEIGTKFDNLSTNGKQTGGIVVNHFYLSIDDSDCMCIGVRPLLTEHHTDVLEIVSQHFLRKKLELINESRLTLYMTEKL